MAALKMSTSNNWDSGQIRSFTTWYMVHQDPPITSSSRIQVLGNYIACEWVYHSESKIKWASHQEF